ncbi:MAG: hypothetical protein COW67_13185 [Flavobacteriales bacterium CG18_big_fil_WC_8_21_14_2_50_32_9]|nr:MAG: hypothetical protein COW67_13185 [Flavobacteriales bacterium CG18_big_fil_WC_8_21_14_2_50_32_9]
MVKKPNLEAAFLKNFASLKAAKIFNFRKVENKLLISEFLYKFVMEFNPNSNCGVYHLRFYGIELGFFIA